MVELWTPRLPSLASLEDSVLSMNGGVNAGLQNDVCPLCTIFSSCGFPVGTQSSFQGLWVGSHEQIQLAVAREHWRVLCWNLKPRAQDLALREERIGSRDPPSQTFWDLGHLELSLGWGWRLGSLGL